MVLLNVYEYIISKYICTYINIYYISRIVYFRDISMIFLTIANHSCDYYALDTEQRLIYYDL